MMAHYRIFLLFLISSLFAVPVTVYAKGHEKCELCHHIVNKEVAGIKIKTDSKSISPFTGKKFGPQDAICITCHPVFTHRRGHIYGIKPKKVKIPESLIGKGSQKGELVCVSCHDPHAGKSYKYLRNDINGLAEVLHVCVLCHPKNASSQTIKEVNEKLKKHGSKMILPGKQPF